MDPAAPEPYLMVVVISGDKSVRALHLAFAVIAVLALPGCVVRDQPDPHRAWWDEHHHGEAYDRNRAEAEHRDYCAHSYDHSCEGWH